MKETKINLSTFLLLIAIIVIIVMGVFIYKLNNDKTMEIQRSTELQAQVNSLNGTISELQGKMNKISETINTSNSSTSELVTKVDSTKDWVYDAEYEKNVTSESYSTSYETYYSKDIVVPYININSSYANNFNNEIKKIFDGLIRTYNEGVSDKTTYIDECGYKKYINSNCLSVILTYGVGETDVVHPQYQTYNVDLKTGKQLSYEEVYKIAGFKSSDINSKVENAITKTLKEKISNAPDYVWNNFETYNSKSINNYKNSIDNNTLKYFLSDNGKLNIVVELNYPAGNGRFDTIITVN